MIKINGLKKQYTLPDGSTIRAIDNVSIEINKGDFAVILGPNGAGKSTLFDLIVGRTFPDSGNVFLNDKDITFYPAHKRAKNITLISQDRGAGLPRAMTVNEVMKLALETIGDGNDREVKKYIKERLNGLGLGLSNIMNNQIWSLSGGEYQLVSLSIATILCEQTKDGNHLLLLDEHISQLSPSVRDKVISTTAELVKQNNLTVLLATHSPGLATAVGSRQIILAKGQVVHDLSKKERIDDFRLLENMLRNAESLNSNINSPFVPNDFQV